jgi:hypothetical protein
MASADRGGFAMEGSTAPLTLQFLAWVAERPRSHEELMASWQSSCPRLTIWEDALAEDLVRFENGVRSTASGYRIALTPRGRALLDANGAGPAVVDRRVV